MTEILDKFTDCIGNTPVLRLQKLSESCGCLTPILAKLEFYSPGGSVKDRAALAMLEGAMQRGQLAPGADVHGAYPACPGKCEGELRL